jgi:hypothetical protein
MGNRLLVRILLIALLALGAASGVNAFSFVDDFNDGVLDPRFWIGYGDGVDESGGSLNIRRNNAADSVGSVGRYSGAFDIRFDILLDRIVWNDMFHGITLMSSNNYGMSFGFSMYQQFYSAEHRPNGTSLYYTGGILDPPTFSLHRWYTFRIVGNTGGSADLYVDGARIFARDLSRVTDFVISFPGLYEDGDGPGIGDSDTTDSRIDNFRLDVDSGSQPAATDIPTLSEWGLIALMMIVATSAGFAIRREAV